MTIEDLKEDLENVRKTIKILEDNKKLKPTEKIALKNAKQRESFILKKIDDVQNNKEDDKKVFGNSDVYTYISIDKIKPNPHQPRKRFDDESLNELALSIKSFGVLQPIVVVEIAGEYIIMAGERRYRASKLAQMDTIPAIVKRSPEYQTSEMLSEIALIENLLREDMALVDEAVAIKKLNDIKGNYRLTGEAIAKGKDYIAQLVTIASFDDVCLSLIDTNSLNNKKLLYNISKDIPKERQLEFLNLVIKNSINLLNYEAFKNKFLSNNDNKKIYYVDDKFTKEDFENVKTVSFKKYNNGKLNIDIDIENFSEADFDKIKELIKNKK